MAEIHRPNIAIMASGDIASGGGGSTMRQTILRAQGGELDADISTVICNNPRGSVGVYDIVDELNSMFGLEIEMLTINGVLYPKGKQERGQTLEEADAICDALATRNIDFVACLGYMKQHNGAVIDEWAWKPEYAVEDPDHNGLYAVKARMSNNHPGWLNDNDGVDDTKNTYGIHASEKALELGLARTAFTLQLVAAGIDAGPKIAEFFVDIEPDHDADTVFGNVQVVEKRETARTLDAHLKNREEHLRATA